MTIQILGAGGQFGRKVVQGLLDRGAAPGDVVACVRNPERVADLAEQGVQVRRGDYDDPASMVEAFAGADAALLIPTFMPPAARAVQHDNACTAAAEAGVGRLLFSSFGSGRTDSRFHVAPFMLYAESRTRLSGLPWTILRNGMYLDPIADWAPELVRMGELPYPVRRGRVAYISRDDLGRATAAAMMDDGHANQTYELTGPEALSMDELAATVSAATGAEIRFESISDERYAQICREGDENVPEYLIPILTSLYHAVDNGEFEAVSDHVRQLSGAPAETAASYLGRVLGG